jgi:hypothetical protein
MTISIKIKLLNKLSLHLTLLFIVYLNNLFRKTFFLNSMGYILVIETQGDGSNNSTGNCFPDIYIRETKEDILELINDNIKDDIIDYDSFYDDKSWDLIQNKQCEIYDQMDNIKISLSNRNKIKKIFDEIDNEANKRSFSEFVKKVLDNGCLVIGEGDWYDKVFKVREIGKNYDFNSDWGATKNAIRKRCNDIRQKRGKFENKRDIIEVKWDGESLWESYRERIEIILQNNDMVEEKKIITKTKTRPINPKNIKKPQIIIQRIKDEDSENEDSSEDEKKGKCHTFMESRMREIKKEDPFINHKDIHKLAMLEWIKLKNKK